MQCTALIAPYGPGQTEEGEAKTRPQTKIDGHEVHEAVFTLVFFVSFVVNFQ